MLVDAAGNDFRTRLGSPGIDSGLSGSALTVNVYQTFSSTYGLDISKDFNRVERPQGNGWDIGAFEYGSSGSGRPAAPQNVRIVF